MDKFTKSYIDDMVKPLLYRIQYLERANQQLKIHVKYLESLILSDSRPYQKPTVSAANHMRDSKLTSKGNSLEKRPGWNSKTKIDQSPITDLCFSMDFREQANNQKPKGKPPVPKNMKSPFKPDEEERNSRSPHKSQKAHKLQGTHERNIGPRNASASPHQDEEESVDGKQCDEENPFESNIGLIRERLGEIGRLNYNFEQLVKNNTEILSGMKQNNQVARDSLKKDNPPNNYVQKVGAPKSEHNHESYTVSPHGRSFVSQSHPELASLEGLKSNLDCALSKEELK